MAVRKATAWRSLGTLCRERDWPPARLLHELRQGMTYRTFPPGSSIDWWNPNVERSLDLVRSEVTVSLGGKVVEDPHILILDLGLVTLGIEVLDEAEQANPPRRQKRKGGRRRQQKGGRPPAADWEAIEEAFRHKVESDGCPDGLNVKGWQTQADVIVWIRDQDQDAADAADSTVRDHARNLLCKYCDQGKRGN